MSNNLRGRAVGSNRRANSNIRRVMSGSDEEAIIGVAEDELTDLEKD